MRDVDDCHDDGDDGDDAGMYTQQYELAEFESLAGCTMQFKENPNIASINASIQGNKALPPVAVQDFVKENQASVVKIIGGQFIIQKN